MKKKFKFKYLKQLEQQIIELENYIITNKNYWPIEITISHRDRVIQSLILVYDYFITEFPFDESKVFSAKVDRYLTQLCDEAENNILHEFGVILIFPIFMAYVES